MDPILGIVILIFAAVVLFSLGAFSYLGYRRTRRETIQRIQQGGEAASARPEAQDSAGLRQNLLQLFEVCGRLFQSRGEGELSYHRRIFLQAGFRRQNAFLIFYGGKSVLAIAFPVSFFLLQLSFPIPMRSIYFMFTSVALALAGFYLPNLWLLTRITVRKEQITRSLPDALDLMVVCVEAGTGLDAAIHRVGEEMRLSSKVLSNEFRLLNLELRAGKQRREALRNLALRANLEDVTSLTTLLIQTERFGTSVAQALRVHSDSMRIKRSQRAEQIAAKLPVKLLFPTILFIFPALFVAVLGPAAIRVFRTLLPTLGGP